MKVAVWHNEIWKIATIRFDEERKQYAVPAQEKKRAAHDFNFGISQITSNRFWMIAFFSKGAIIRTAFYRL